jgi:hypothetical protein
VKQKKSIAEEGDKLVVVEPAIKASLLHLVCPAQHVDPVLPVELRHHISVKGEYLVPTLLP